jgi:hypothetical protein
MKQISDDAAANRASMGGKSRSEKLSPDERKAIARKAAKERWERERAKASITHHGQDIEPTIVVDAESASQNGRPIPVARWRGAITIGATDIQCYVLDDGRRVVTRAAALSVLTDGKGGGKLEQYLEVESLRGFVPSGFSEELIEFDIPGVTVSTKTTRGISAEAFIEICQAYVSAFESNALTTERQREIAIKAAMFLAACAKLGLIAMIDEATGYQYERASDALQIKLKLFLAEEMRKWEKTFPDQLWEQFGRLTNWKGSLHSRPKYWGNLVMELIYQYLDPDVAEWLRTNAPKPQHGRNYHQWLSEQYGLRRLVEHIWKVVGIASTCATMDDLRREMQRLYGKNAAFQFAVKIVKKSQATGQGLLFDPQETVG